MPNSQFPMNNEMRRNFDNREELITYLKEQFPEAAKRDENISETLGGYKAAEKALQKVDPKAYAKTRNFLNGRVTRLSPYLRYGVLSLREVRDYAISIPPWNKFPG